MGRKEKFAAPWKEFATRWQRYYTPPGRPSAAAIKIYKEFIKKATAGIQKPKVLVLGATPELRDLLAQLKFAVTIIDVNWEMILAMTSMLKHKNPEEIIVCANWLANPLASNYFDVVVGDIVLSNIPKEKQNQFLKEVSRLLKSAGYFISKMEVVPTGWQKFSFKEVLDKFAKLPKRPTNAIELFVELHNNVWNPQTQIADTSKIKKLIDQYRRASGTFKHPNKKVTRYLNDMWAMWQPMEKRWSFGTERATSRQVSISFKIIEKRILNDCSSRQLDASFPIWLMRKK